MKFQNFKVGKFGNIANKYPQNLVLKLYNFKFGKFANLRTMINFFTYNIVAFADVVFSNTAQIFVYAISFRFLFPKVPK